MVEPGGGNSREAQTIFEGFQQRTTEFLQACQKLDGSDRFVQILAQLVSQGIKDATEAKKVAEILRDRTWLKFIQTIRQADFDVAEALLMQKNQLLEILNNTTKNQGTDFHDYRNGSRLGRTEEENRYSY